MDIGIILRRGSRVGRVETTEHALHRTNFRTKLAMYNHGEVWHLPSEQLQAIVTKVVAL